ncbi:serine protease [Amycolatopsis sp. NBC_00345]|uniref:trypsin-like peptidase domain-containing protein n=1 Tax=Amycolatopsis sp. NBC_00345 TaxID=2975955 RepID=UPI002E256C44
MRSSIRYAFLGTVAVATVSLTVVPAVNAATLTSSSASEPDVVMLGGQSPDYDATTRAYWTPQRMREAVPLDDVVAPGTRGEGEKSTAAAGPASPPTVILPAESKSGSGTGARVETDPYDTRSVGKLFIRQTNGNVSCTAVAVNGGKSGNLLATATHCLSPDKGKTENADYVPAYSKGTSPYDSFPVRAYVPTAGWTPGHPQQHDAAFVVTAPSVNGRNPGDIGYQNGLAFNNSPDQRVTVVGYGNKAGDTEQQYGCVGVRAFRDPSDSTRIAVNCVFGPGASGGPFFVTDDQGVYNVVTAVIRGSAGNQTREVGPLFGDSELQAYNTAVATS